VETKELDLGLQLVTLWLEDLAFLTWDARDLVRNTDRLDELQADSGVDSARLREAIELIEDTRQRFQLNVSEDLACEALAYRLEAALGS
jgi:DNA polymerase-3 subunit delta'